MTLQERYAYIARMRRQSLYNAILAHGMAGGMQKTAYIEEAEEQNEPEATVTSFQITLTESTDLTQNYMSKFKMLDSSSSLTIDWGDGTVETYTKDTDIDSYGYTKNTVKHTYADYGTYIVKISDDLYKFCIGSFSAVNRYVTAALSYAPSLKDVSQAYLNCYNLTGSVPKWGRSITTAEYAYAFTGITGLIPEWGESLTDVFAAYRNCTGLTGIWNDSATAEEIMPSRITNFWGCVFKTSDAITSKFSGNWITEPPPA